MASVRLHVVCASPWTLLTPAGSRSRLQTEVFQKELQGEVSQSWLSQKAHGRAMDLGMYLLNLGFFGLYISSYVAKCFLRHGGRGETILRATSCSHNIPSLPQSSPGAIPQASQKGRHYFTGLMNYYKIMWPHMMATGTPGFPVQQQTALLPSQEVVDWQMPHMYPRIPTRDTPSFPNPIPTPLRHASMLETCYVREGTFIFLKRLVDQHMSLEFVFPIEGRVTH